MFLEVALHLQNAQILPLNSWKSSASESPDAATRVDRSGHSLAISSMDGLDASQLVLRVSKYECRD